MSTNWRPWLSMVTQGLLVHCHWSFSFQATHLTKHSTGLHLVSRNRDDWIQNSNQSGDFLHRCAGKLHTVHAYSSVMFCHILCPKYPNVHICVNEASGFAPFWFHGKGVKVTIRVKQIWANYAKQSEHGPLGAFIQSFLVNQCLEEESLQVRLAVVALAYQTATAAVSLYIV